MVAPSGGRHEKGVSGAATWHTRVTNGVVRRGHVLARCRKWMRVNGKRGEGIPEVAPHEITKFGEVHGVTKLLIVSKKKTSEGGHAMYKYCSW